jgi:hypothetical protein
VVATPADVWSLAAVGGVGVPGGRFRAPDGSQPNAKTATWLKAAAEEHARSEAMFSRRRFTEDSSVTKDPSETIIFLQVQAPRPIGEMSLRAKNGWGLGYSYGGETGANQAVCYYYVDPSSMTPTDVKIGLAETPFKPIGRSIRSGGVFKPDGLFDLKPVLRQVTPYISPDENGEAPTPELNLRCILPKVDDDADTRLVLFFRDGTSTDSGGGQSAPTVDMTYTGIAAVVDRIEFQARSYVWTTFQGVRLKPAPKN